MTTPVRLAYVRYLNTRPLVEGLESSREIELIPAAPSHIADMVRRGEADLGLVSVVDLVSGEGDEPLAVAPVGMIGCDGPTMTVRLYSATPLERVKRFHADTESHTSVVLARLILGSMTGAAPEVVSFDARERVAGGTPEEWPETMLMIGDKVVTDSPPAVRYPHQLDLGEAWKERTGLPFVYATWACRAGEAGSSRIAAAAAVLERQLRHNLTRLDWLLETRSGDHRWPTDLARKYVVELLRYEIGARERAGLERFLEEAAGEGLLERSEVSWIDWRGVLAGG